MGQIITAIATIAAISIPFLGSVGSIVASLAFSLVANYLFASKPRYSSRLFGGDDGVQTSVREATPERQFVFGEVVVGGAIIYQSDRGTDGVIDMVFAVATHPIDSVRYILIYGKPLFLHTINLDSVGEPIYTPLPPEDVTQALLNANNIISPITDQQDIQTRFADYVQVQYRLDGTTAPFVDLRQYGDWAASDKATGCALIWMSLIWDRDTWTSGLPNPAFLLRGANTIYDPRDDTAKYTHNPALIASWLIQSFPTGITSTIIDQEVLAESANACEVQASYMTASGTTVTEDTYEAHGRALSSDPIIDYLQNDLAISMAGAITWSRLGGWQIIASRYTAPLLAIEPADIVSSTVVVRPKAPWASRFNAVDIRYRSRVAQQLGSQAPQITSLQYQEEDGRKLQRDIDLPLTTSIGCAQRIGQQILKRSRSELNIRLRILDIDKGFALRPWDIVSLQYPDLSINGEFRVLGWRSIRNDNTILIGLELQEVKASEYVYEEDFELYVDPSYNARGDSGSSLVPALTGLTATSTQGTATILGDGTVLPAITVSWDSTSSPYREDTLITWDDGQATTSLNTYQILNVLQGTTYTVTARHRNSLGVLGASMTVLIEAAGKETPPSDLMSLSLVQSSSAIEALVTGIVDRDASYIEVRYIRVDRMMTPATMSLVQFEDDEQTVLAGFYPAPHTVAGTAQALISILQGGIYTLGVRLYDTSGNASPGIVTNFITFLPAFDLLSCVRDEPLWQGTSSGYFLHRGILLPTGNIQASIATVSDWLTYDLGSPGLPADSYTAVDIDFGEDKQVDVKTDIGGVSQYEHSSDPPTLTSPSYTPIIQYQLDGSTTFIDLAVAGTTSDDRLATLSGGVSTIGGSPLIARRVRVKIAYDTSVATHRTPYLYSIITCISERT